MEEDGKFYCFNLFLAVLIFAAVVIVMIPPRTEAAVDLTATVLGAGLTVGRIRICDGTCELAKTLDPATTFTIEIVITDPNGQSDINTESIHVELYRGGDANGCTESWDCNVMELVYGDDNMWLGSGNGCNQAGSTYCINLPDTVWTTKFLDGADANIFVRVDDNDSGGTHFIDFNYSTALTVNQNLSRSEDATTGAYSGVPDTNDAILTDAGNTGVTTTHNGNCDMDVTIRGTDLNESGYSYPDGIFIGDNNQTWAHSTIDINYPITGSATDSILADWNRGILATSDSNTQDINYWLYLPLNQAVGDYTGTMTYNATAS